MRLVVLPNITISKIVMRGKGRKFWPSNTWVLCAGQFTTST